jgi:hypothetical protein
MKILGTNLSFLLGLPLTSGTNSRSTLQRNSVILSIQGLESRNEPNVKAIVIELKAITKQYPDLVVLSDTELGLSVCFKGSDMEVELMQMTGASGNEYADTLESRFQYITKKVYLDNGERNRISFLLQTAQFKPVPGQHGSFRMAFGETATVKFDKNQLTKLKEAVVEMAKITKAARNRSWK